VRTWLEPCHALTYFAPEALAAFEGAGLRGFWRGYFAGRAAPLGAVGPGVVTATFYGFHPSFVGRAVPSIWELAAPTVVLAARLAGVDAALRRILGESVDGAAIATAAAQVRDSLAQCQPAGRALYAANADLPWPEVPHLVLWHAATLLREHRGDGHVVALVDAEIAPCEAHVLRVAVSGLDAASIQPHRGWSDPEWSEAMAALQARGWLDTDGAATDTGRSARAAIEAETDRLAAPVTGIDLALLRTVLAPVIASGVIPYPNAMGVPRP